MISAPKHKSMWKPIIKLRFAPSLGKDIGIPREGQAELMKGGSLNDSKKSLQWIAWVLIMPVLVLRGFTTIYPIVKTVLNSFFDIRILSGVNEFAGLSNYINIFKDQKVITTLKFTAIFVVVSMLFHIVFGIGLALILNMKFKGRRFYELSF